MLALNSVSSPVSAQSAPPAPPGSPAASPLPADPVWVVTLEALTERSAPDEESEPVATPRQFTFPLIRRVANETMNRDTIGIPRFGPGGYYLTNVLFTQYFTADGASLHYNYWSSNWGYAASHGCLGLTYADSAFLWSWAGLGTLVSIHD